MYKNVYESGYGGSRMMAGGGMYTYPTKPSNDWTGFGFGAEDDQISRRLEDASQQSASRSLDTAAGAISLGPVIAAVIVIGLIVAVIAIFLQLGNSVLGLVQNIAGQ